MSTKIIYDGIDFFGINDLPTPSISTESSKISMGENLGDKTSINLSGSIFIKNKEDCNLRDKLEEKRDLLINHFSKDFKSLVIEDNGATVLEKDFCKIISISFPDSNYISFIEYIIQIEAYDEYNYNSFFGIKEPVKNINIQKLKNGNYDITRSISAVGENLQDGNLTGDHTNSISSGLENAIDFVNSFDFESDLNLYLGEGFRFYRNSKSETINRLSNHYAIEENYIATNDSKIEEGVLEYTIQKSKSFEGYNRYAISGEISGGDNINFSKIKSSFNKLDPLSLIENSLNETGINKYPVSSNISEDENGNRISFQYNFSSQDGTDECGIKVLTNYSIEDNEAYINLNLSGSFQSSGPKLKRWNKVNDFYKNLTFDNINYSSWFQQIAQEKINEYYNGKSLKDKEISKNISFHEEDGRINFSIQFSTRENQGFNIYDETISVQLKNPNYSIDMNYGTNSDKYIISNSGNGKGVINIQLAAEYNDKNKTKADAAVELNAIAENNKNRIVQDFFQNDNCVLSNESGSYEYYKNVISRTWVYNIY